MTINHSAVTIVADSWLVLGFLSIFLPELPVCSCYCLAKHMTVLANATTAPQQIAGNNCHSHGPVPFFQHNWQLLSLSLASFVTVAVVLHGDRRCQYQGHSANTNRWLIVAISLDFLPVVANVCSCYHHLLQANATATVCSSIVVTSTCLHCCAVDSTVPQQTASWLHIFYQFFSLWLPTLLQLQVQNNSCCRCHCKASLHCCTDDGWLSVPPVIYPETAVAALLPLHCNI